MKFSVVFFEKFCIKFLFRCQVWNEQQANESAEAEEDEEEVEEVVEEEDEEEQVEFVEGEDAEDLDVEDVDEEDEVEEPSQQNNRFLNALKRFRKSNCIIILCFFKNHSKSVIYCTFSGVGIGRWFKKNRALHKEQILV